MVSQTSHISASLVNDVTTEIPSGRGVVDKQIDESTFVIRMPSGSITVKVTEGSLSQGDSVSVSYSGEAIYIEKLPVPAETLEDMLELRLSPKIEEVVVLLKELRNTLLSKPIENDLLRQLDIAIQFFEKKDTAVSSLQQVINQLKSEIMSKFDTLNLSSDQETISRVSAILSNISEKVLNLSGMSEEIHSVSQSQVVTLSKAPEPGMHYIYNGKDALTLLLKYSIRLEHSANELLKTFTDKPLFVRFYESVNGTKKAVVMPWQQALVEIEHVLRIEMQSEIMRKLNPSIVAETIIQRGNLNMSQLLEIDKLLMFVSADNDVPFLKTDALSISWPQLVAVALEVGDKKLPNFEAALTRIGSRIPGLVQEILELLDKSGEDFRLTDIKKIIFESISLDHIEKKEDFLPSLFKNMGFSLEHEMVESFHGRSTGLQKDSPSLKLALLLLLGRLNTFVDGKDLIEKGYIKEGNVEKTMMPSKAMIEPAKTSKSFVQEGSQLVRGSSSFSRMPAEVIRQQVETVLNHIESLQMLAKPVTTSEGEQQVLTLPVNIGNEWTELRIKFVKRHSRKKRGRKSKQISVMLNVDLTSLGEITAYMDYIIKKSFNVSLTFDNVRAKIWFQKNKRAFIEALRGLGLPVVHVNMLDRSIQMDKNNFIPQKIRDPRINLDVWG